jgi:Na+/H+ antiporter NhaD/arsenite permease-like protein
MRSQALRHQYFTGLPMRIFLQLAVALILVCGVNVAHAATPMIGSIPIDFILFACVLAGVALLHKHSLKVAVIGAVVIALYKILFSTFKVGTGLSGFAGHLGHEWVLLANLLCLLVGFALLSNHFEHSKVPKVLPHFLPDDWKGGFVLLVLVFVLSAFLDNIAAALIGGTVASAVFRKKVHVGYLAGIVAASNAGGSGSVVGDTTTTMLWLAGASPLSVLDAYVAATVAVAIVGVVASKQQQAYSPIIKDARIDHRVDWPRLGIVFWILAVAIVANVLINTRFGDLGEHFPVLGVAVWVAILIAIPVRKPDWSLIPDAAKGAVFLLSLVLCASMMPVEELPQASWPTVFGLGFLSAVFDNIPLTELAIKQGGYDWGMLAYCVGFGGSMIWFGSSAGVALSSQFPEARNAVTWVKQGWHVAVAYVIGFFVMLALTGWHPTPLKATSALLMPIAA